MTGIGVLGVRGALESLECPGQLPSSKSRRTPDVNSAETEKPWA